MEENKNKRLFSKKMSQKVHFGLPEDEDDDDDDDDDSGADGEPKAARRVRRLRNKSSLSVLQRFQNFLHSNASKDSAKIRSDDDDDVQKEDDEEEEEEVGEEEVGKEEEGDNVDEEGEESENEEAGVGDGDGDGDDEEAASSASNASFDWFFSAQSSSSVVLPKQKPTGDFNGFSIFKSWNEAAGFKADARWKSLGEVVGLPKLWKSRASNSFDPMTSLLLPHLSNYCDTLIDGRDHINEEELLKTILLHSCVHTFRARSKVQKHNSNLKKKLIAAKQDEGGGGGEGKKAPYGSKAASADPGENLDAVYQDQGFARPRVLILCPFRGVALKCVETILEIYGDKTSVANLDKFVEEYGPPDFSDDDGSEGDSEDEDDSEGGGDEMEEDDREGKIKADPKKKSTSGKRKRPKAAASKTERPDDWKADFRQNVDDDFKIGVQVNPGHGKGSGANKGVYLRLYSDFFISDILIASPLALRFIIENGSKDSADFLSSIEVVILHQADVMYMQNWDHVDFVLRHTNKLPSSNNDIDFARVRPYFLDGKASRHRQLIMTTFFNEPPIQACFREHGKSIAGTVRLCKNWKEGVIPNVMRRVNQVFQRVHSDAFLKHEDDRFAYFKESVLGPLLRTNQQRTIIFTPSYISYVRVRNELMRQEANAAFICEYSRESEISRGRSRFFNGSKDILLYSGRFHYFRRYNIRGANHIIFYSLPEFPQFYPELVNLVTDSTESTSTSSSCLALFTKFEKMALERLVGKKWSNHLLTSDKRTFLFR